MREWVSGYEEEEVEEEEGQEKIQIIYLHVARAPERRATDTLSPCKQC